jgi:hypothetical protein
MKIHSKSKSLNAKILRKGYISSLLHGRLNLENHPFFDTPYCICVGDTDICLYAVTATHFWVGNPERNEVQSLFRENR